MDSGAGDGAIKPTAPVPPQKSSNVVQPSKMVKAQANGGSDIPSTSTFSALARGPSAQQIATMTSAKPKGKKKGRGGKKNGHNNNNPKESAVSSPRSGDRGVGPQHSDHHDGQPHNQQHNDSRGNLRNSGNQRGNIHKPGNSSSSQSQHHQHEQDTDRSNSGRGYQNGGGLPDSPPKGQTKPFSSSSLSAANNRKPHLSPREREPIEACIEKFVTNRHIQSPKLSVSTDNSSCLKLGETSFPVHSDRDSAPSSSTSSGTTSTVTTAPLSDPSPPKAPEPKPSQLRTSRILPQNEPGSMVENVSQQVTPVPIPKTVSTSSSKSTHFDNATPMHPTPADVPLSAPTQSSSFSPSQGQSGAAGTPSLLQLMEEHKRNKSAWKGQFLMAENRDPRSKSAHAQKSFPNGVRNHNDPRTPGIPPGIIELQKNLPIFPVKRELMDIIRKNRVVIVIGDPGSGKSTQLPQYLLEAGFAKNGKIGVTEPRRVAAKTLAERVALEVGQPVGSTVGYAVRFDRQMSGQTVIKYMTDGVLVQECANPAHLEEYSVVIIDEAHERSVHTDICFGLLKREAERVGSKLKIIISSATLEQEKFVEYFGGAPVFSIPRKDLHQPEIIYTWDENYLQKTLKIIQDINQNDKYPEGDILVFLSGQDEIEDLTKLLNRSLHEINRPDSQLQIVQCYGALTFNEQMKIFDPAPENCRKVILATNIAETSITIEGVVYVIDCGYFKECDYNPLNGISYLRKKRITKFQAIQRLGRATRAEKGICFRLYSEQDLEEMEEAGVPEITRCNLESTILDLAAMGITGWDFNKAADGDKMPIKELDLMDLPSRDSVIYALEHLMDLSAAEAAGTGFKLTARGKLMASFHLGPSLSRVLIESMELGCAQESLKIVALLSANYQHMDRRSRRKSWRSFIILMGTC